MLTTFNTLFFREKKVVLWFEIQAKRECTHCQFCECGTCSSNAVLFSVIIISKTKTFVLFIDIWRHGDHVRHYHIKEENGELFISDRHRYPTVPELVNYHQHNSGGNIGITYIWLQNTYDNSWFCSITALNSIFRSQVLWFLDTPKVLFLTWF